MNNIPDIQQIIGKIMDILGIGEDKESFTKDFMDAVLQESFIEFFSVVPPDRKAVLQREFAIERSPEEIEKILQRYITPQEYYRVISATTQKLLKEYLDPLVPTLSDEQKRQLNAYLFSIVEPLNQQYNTSQI